MYKKEIKDNRNVEDKLNDITVVVASHRISEDVILFTKCWLMSESSKKYNLVIGYDKDWNVDDIKKIKQLLLLNPKGMREISKFLLFFKLFLQNIKILFYNYIFLL